MAKQERERQRIVFLCIDSLYMIQFAFVVAQNKQRMQRAFHSSSILLARTFKRRLLPTTASVPATSAPTGTSSGSALAPGAAPASSVGAPVAAGGGGLMGMIAEGFAFGVGSSIARNVVGSLWPGGGGGEGAAPPAPPPPPADGSGFSHNYEDERGGEGDGGGDDDEF